MKEVFIRTPYNYDTNKAGDESGLRCRDKSRTSQEFREEVDINTIVGRFLKTGVMPENLPLIFDGDFTQVADFRGAQDLIVQARESFQALPAGIRAKFDHDAGAFVAWASDRKNYDEALALGLVRPEVAAQRAEELKAQRRAEIDAAVAARDAELAKGSVEPARGKGAKAPKDQSST